MNLKKVASTVLLLFVTISLVYLAVSSKGTSTNSAEPTAQAAGTCTEGGNCEPQKASIAGGPAIVAYYFHRTARCRTCRALESNAREAIQSNLAKELAKGELSVQSLNVEEPANRHFIERYQITGPSLVLSHVQDGKEVRWKNLDLIWDLIRTPSQYQAYVAAEVKAFVSGRS